MPETDRSAVRWWADRWFLAALAVGLVLRVLPLVLWPQTECIRDECIYRAVAFKIVDGFGLTTSSKGWLPAPGYPYLLAACRIVFGTTQSVKVLQIGLSVVSLGFIYGIGRRVADLRVARIAVFLFALNPTLAWFSTTLWIETVYIFCLLGAAFLMLESGAVSAKGRNGVGWAGGAGGLLGLAVLFRGIATYLPPLFVLSLLSPAPSEFGSLRAWRDQLRARWRSVLAFLGVMVVVVSPWSIHASQRYGGFMVSDATVGHVMFLGNNDFPPLTFDYGNGMLTQALFGRYLKTGRRPCRRSAPPVQSSSCEVRQAVGWAKRNPGRFLARVPVRLAQILNPNSFFTRHLRWGYWAGFPWWAKEGLIALIALCSMALMVPGTLAAWAKARGPWAWIAVGTTIYTIAVTAMMYGMSRFRLPLEAMWTVYLAMFLADPRGVWRELEASPGRMVGALLTIPPIIALALWYLPTGWPMFWR